jgi:hypothetical protein
MDIQKKGLEGLVNQDRLIRTNSKERREPSSQRGITMPEIKPKSRTTPIMDMKPGPRPEDMSNLENTIPKLGATLAPRAKQRDRVRIFGS